MTQPAEILRRIEADIETHQAGAEMLWRNRSYIEAIRHREMVEGLKLARLHVRIALDGEPA